MSNGSSNSDNIRPSAVSLKGLTAPKGPPRTLSLALQGGSLGVGACPHGKAAHGGREGAAEPRRNVLGISKLITSFPSLALIDESPLLRPYLPYAECFCLYLLQKESLKIVLHLLEGDEDVFVRFPYPHRWRDSYKKMMNARLFDLTENFPYRGPWSMVTLTVGPHFELEESFRVLQSGRKKMIDLLRYYGVDNFFWVMEPHRSGWPHVHLACPYDLTAQTQSLKLRWNSYGAGSIAHGLDIDVKDHKQNIDSLRNYLMAYLRPSLEESMTAADLVYNSMAWYHGYRFWGCSRYFTSLMEKPTHYSSLDWIRTGVDDEGFVRWMD